VAAIVKFESHRSFDIVRDGILLSNCTSTLLLVAVIVVL
jgi:hypothetical protein